MDLGSFLTPAAVALLGSTSSPRVVPRDGGAGLLHRSPAVPVPAPAAVPNHPPRRPPLRQPPAAGLPAPDGLPPHADPTPPASLLQPLAPPATLLQPLYARAARARGPLRPRHAHARAVAHSSHEALMVGGEREEVIGGEREEAIGEERSMGHRRLAARVSQRGRRYYRRPGGGKWALSTRGRGSTDATYAYPR
jgi:hypothetical protein